MKNHVPKEFCWSNKNGRQKERGEYEKHHYSYNNAEGNEKQLGLIIWKDRKPVYVLTSECGSDGEDYCTRRSKEGLLKIKRPTCIKEYNTYMGGVDIAD